MRVYRLFDTPLGSQLAAHIEPQVSICGNSLPARVEVTVRYLTYFTLPRVSRVDKYRHSALVHIIEP